MATTTKKRGKIKTKQHRPKVKTSPTKQAREVAELRQQVVALSQGQEATAKELQNCKRQLAEELEQNSRLSQELQARNHELAEALEQQTTTSEILRVIAGSPSDMLPVFQTILDNAVHLCEAQNGAVFRFDGEVFRAVAANNISAALQAYIDSTPIRPGRESALRRVGLEKRPVHIPDMLADPECIVPQSYREEGMRTSLAVPLLKENELIGAIAIHRHEVRPFTENQIRLLETFADQAVIAIENVRLFKEIQERNAELREALEHQTATSEVLGIISRSPTDVQPVLDAIVESAARVCGIDDVALRLREGNSIVSAAHVGPIPVGGVRSIDDPQIHWIREHGTLHVPDIKAQKDFPTMGSTTGSRTFLLVPLRQQGELIGILVARRTEVSPFSPAQIKLLETFASQAVIAIANVRLFRELKESLEQQTATSEILGVIASSPTDIQPVLNAVAENAARLCDSQDAQIYQVDGGMMCKVARYGDVPDGIPLGSTRKISRGSNSGRAIVERQPVHIHDMLAQTEEDFPDVWHAAQQEQLRTVLAVPLMREETPIGAVLLRRIEAKPFTEKQIKLLATFASQGVIAIENVRLFRELQARTGQLARSIEELRALGEVGQAVSSSLDLPTVLNTIVGRAVQLSGTECGIIYEYDEPKTELHLRASHRMEEELVESIRAAPLHIGEGYTGQAALAKAPVQVSDLRIEKEFRLARIRSISERFGYRSLLTVPILLENRLMGALTVWRKREGSFTPELVNLLQTFATQSALAIQNARLFREIEEKSSQIEAANRHKSEFLANMSHGLRTPSTPSSVSPKSCRKSYSASLTRSRRSIPPTFLPPASICCPLLTRSSISPRSRRDGWNWS